MSDDMNLEPDDLIIDPEEMAEMAADADYQPEDIPLHAYESELEESALEEPLDEEYLELFIEDTKDEDTYEIETREYADPGYEEVPAEILEAAADDYETEKHNDITPISTNVAPTELTDSDDDNENDAEGALQLDFGWSYEEDDDNTVDEPSASSLEEALKLCKIDIRFNARSRDTECIIQNASTSADSSGTHWEPYSDLCEGFIKRQIYEKVSYQKLLKDGTGLVKRWETSAIKWTEWCHSIVYQRQIDPFAEWLAALPDWDKQERQPLSACFDIDPSTDPDLLNWAAWQPLYGSVRRALDPAFKIDQMVVLFGTQGCGKSTYWAYMMPQDMRSEWAADGFVFTDDYQRRIEKVLGAVIVEADEMTGSKRADVNAMKSFLTQSHGRVRLAYRKNPESIPFRHILVGTSNQKESLPNDPTGLRRFLPITVGGDPYTNVHRIRDWWDTNRLQVWAEAWQKCIVDPYITDMPAYLYERQAQQAEAHRSTTEEEEMISNQIKEMIEEKLINKVQELNGSMVEYTQPGVQAALDANLITARAVVLQPTLVYCASFPPALELLDPIDIDINIRELAIAAGLAKEDDARLESLLEHRSRAALTRYGFQPSTHTKRITKSDGKQSFKRFWARKLEFEIVTDASNLRPDAKRTNKTIDDINTVEDILNPDVEPF